MKFESNSFRKELPKDDDQAPTLLHWNSGSDLRTISDAKNDASGEWLTKELRKQFVIAGPMTLVSLLNFALSIVSLIFVGHLGEVALSSSQIAVTIAMATGLNIMMGLSSALETLCGQAYGAKEYYLTGIYLQRAIYVLTLVAIPLSFIWWNLARVLIAVGQDPVISEGAQEYTRFLIPSLFAYAFLQPLVKFMQTQSVVKAMAVFSAITLVIHVMLCYLVIYYLGVGFRGAAIVTGISHWINVSFLAIYVIKSSTFKKTWTGLSTEAFRDVYPFLKVAVPSTLLICFQYWCFDIFVLASGLLPNPLLETSSFSVCVNTIALLSMIPFGFSTAVSTRVANELGAGRPQAAKDAVTVSVSLVLIEGCTVAMVLMSLRRVFPYIFISEPHVVDHASRMLPLVAVISLLDGYQNVLCGVAKGCGRQHLGAWIDLCSFYGISLPVGLLLTFYFELDSYGLWIGILSGFLTQAVLLSSITITSNWEKLACQAAELVRGAGEHHAHDLTKALLKEGSVPTTHQGTVEDPAWPVNYNESNHQKEAKQQKSYV